jgi:tetratricopeptide (TPR) repeat protein
MYVYDGKYSQAEALLTQTLETDRKVLGPSRGQTLTLLWSIGTMYQLQGKYDLAETNLSEALAGKRKLLGADHPDTSEVAAALALAKVSLRKFTESEALARGAETMEQTKRPDGWLRFWAESLLGASLAGEKKYAEAEPLLLDGYRGMMERKDRIAVPKWRHLESSHEWIFQMYQAWGKPEKAIEWKTFRQL